MSMVSLAVGIAVPAACFAVYQSLWYRPQWWRRESKRKQTLPNSEVIAHRGSRNEGIPENTIAAFRHALAAGANVIECDVWLSKDKQIIVHHDESLLRMTGVDATVGSLAYSDYPKIKVEKDYHPFEKQDLEKIPRLVDVADLLPRDRAIIIEIKQDSWELIEAVHKVIKEKGLEKNVFWFSLQEPINKKLRKIDSSIPTITSIHKMIYILFLYYIGLLPFFDIEEQVFGITIEEIPLSRIRNEKSMKNVPDILRRALAWLVQGRPPQFLILPKLFTHLRRRGIPVWFMGVNEESELQLAVKAGATGVLTDRIDWLCKTRKEHPHWKLKSLNE